MLFNACTLMGFSQETLNIVHVAAAVALLLLTNAAVVPGV
jgi:hypothetical protein